MIEPISKVGVSAFDEEAKGIFATLPIDDLRRLRRILDETITAKVGGCVAITFNGKDKRGETSIQIIKDIREVTGFGLSKARDICVAGRIDLTDPKVANILYNLLAKDGAMPEVIKK